MNDISDRDFSQLVEFVKKGYGIDLKDKKFIVQSRLTNYVSDCGFKDFSEFFKVVFSDTSGREAANLVNRLTTNHTYFMRESEHFRHFMTEFLPEAEKRVMDHDLRIWSAGCSYGNEAYDLAMCLEEYFGFRGDGWDLKILATDVSQNVLRSAQRGVYTEQSVERLPIDLRRKYFEQTGHGLYRVCDKLRSRVVFRYHNLMDEINFKKKFDLIVCRNVMIYFDEDTRAELIRKFCDATEEGGYLYLGHAESIPEDMPYKRVRPAIYRKEARA
ncbi:MAG: protein-glutamate O-methyltransferase CheR [Ruminococcus sp.]|nr:protein-glutamate O-methyltransferase CheR [Ruminococcus sp.]